MPSYLGIGGNEAADEQAKMAAESARDAGLSVLRDTKVGQIVTIPPPRSQRGVEVDGLNEEVEEGEGPGPLP